MTSANIPPGGGGYFPIYRPLDQFHTYPNFHLDTRVGIWANPTVWC
jgi:hypothetical protein